MNNKIVKTVDEYNIDRDANVMFAFDLEGSEYVSYKINRDEEQDNLFVSKVLKNLDGTYNMVNVDDTAEKSKLNSIVMSLVESAVKNPADKLAGDSVSLSDGKMIKFIAVSFNKEQKIEVRKTYVTTVKKEVSRVAEKYYDVVSVVEQPKVVEDIFPTVVPVTKPALEEVKSEVVPTSMVETPVVSVEQVAPAVVESVTVSESAINVVQSSSEKVEPVESVPLVEPTPVIPTPVVETPVVSVEQVAPAIVESVTVSEPVISVVQPIPEKVEPVESVPLVEPTPVIPTPVVETPVASVEQPISVIPTPVTVVPESVAVVNESPALVFDGSKETNLNAALGEVASMTTIPVENINSVREFGVEEPAPAIVNPQPVVAPVVNNEASVVTPIEPKKAGFANSKFFMLVAVAFFLASCVFLGYEVFNYFQLTK